MARSHLAGRATRASQRVRDEPTARASSGTPIPDEPSGPGRRYAPSASLLGAVTLGITAVEVLHEGGFWHFDASVIAVSMSVILLIGAIFHPPGWRGWAVISTVVLLAGWWFVRAHTAGPGTSFLPLGASLLGFAAAFTVTRALEPVRRTDAALGVGVVGALVALAGFVGLIWRWYPLAIQSQYTWRLASTITYSDAAGLIIALGLLMGLSGRAERYVSRLIVCLSAGGLIATQSRGALVAFAAACLFVPLAQYWKFLVPLLCGLGVGVAAVATSPWQHRVPLLGAVLVVALVVSAVPGMQWAPRTGRQKIGFLGVVIAAAVVSVVLVHTEIGIRALAPSDQDRAVEWSAALRQFESSPWVGVGPDRLLTFVASDGTYAHFAHNEYLQILADGGIVGGLLVALWGAAAVRVIRRYDVLSACAISGVVCWAVGGAFDFDWHLPVIGILGGWILGLAARENT